MEEKRPGQQPEADRSPEGTAQTGTARPGGHAAGGIVPTERDRELLRAADDRGEEAADAMRARGFGHRDSGDAPEPGTQE